MVWRRGQRISDEELDWALRAALRAETENLELSPEVWERVRARIEDPSLDRRRLRKPGWQYSLASVLQGAVLVVLVLGVGLTFNQGIHQDNWALPTAQYAIVTEAPRVRPAYPDDALTVGRMTHMAQQPAPGDWRWSKF